MEDLSNSTFLRDLLRQRSGLVFAESKGYLIESRLAPIARSHGHSGVAAMLRELQRRPDESVTAAIVEAMTTNETSFFRDGRPFQQLATVILPQLRRARAGVKRLRLWSAAASTGQEAYTLAICLAEAEGDLRGWSHEIVGTDLATDVLNRAREGSYTPFEVQRGLSPERLARWFTSDGQRYRVKPELARGVSFKTHNLLEDPTRLGTFDLVFLRNVLIYFDVPTKQLVLGHIRKVLAPDGYLVLGGAETVLGLTNAFTPMTDAPGFYKSAPAGAAPVFTRT